MKRLIMSLFALCMWGISLHAQSGEFDPANPGDPMPYYTLTVNVSPSSGGTTNVTRTMVPEGKRVYIEIYATDSFRLQQWVCGEEILSQSTYLYYTMPARNVVVTAQMVRVEPEQPIFDPTSPPDPTGDGEAIKYHMVTITSSPSVGGYTSYSAFSMREGSQQNIYAYNNAGYEFEGWYIGDRLESTNNPVWLTMQDKDIALTARFRFNPISPEDPGANYFDRSTGELIIDRFKPGRLSDIIYHFVGYDYSQVQTLIVAGEMSSSDYGVVRNFSNLSVLDLSRTTGYTAVPSWAFENMNKLTRILLPPSLETIGNYAFYNCSMLQEIVLYAPAPPTANQSVSNLFYNTPENIIVRVTAASVPLYQASDLWGSMTILPMDVKALNVSIPKEKVELYENMYLELLDTKSGQLRRYVVTQRDIYAFSGVFEGSTYQLTLRNAQNKVFGQEMVTFAGNDTTVTFASLLQPVNISLQVLNPEGKDMTDHISISWIDNEGKFLNKGTSLSGLVEGDIVQYAVALDEELGVDYMQPAPAVIVAHPDSDLIKAVLTPIPVITLKGQILDSVTRAPIHDATIRVIQRLNGKYQQIVNAQSDSEGAFTMPIKDEEADIVVLATDYTPMQIVRNKQTDLGQLLLAPVVGMNITLLPDYTKASEGEEIQKDAFWQDWQNVSYTLYNHTRGEYITRYEVNVQQLVLKEPAGEGDSIVLTAQSLNHSFSPVEVGTRIADNKAVVVLPMVELGGVAITVQSMPEEGAMAMLYDGAGRLIYKSDLSHYAAAFTHLDAANYSLVIMQKNPQFNSISVFSDLKAMGLKENENFIYSPISVQDGKQVPVNIQEVPALNIQEEGLIDDANTLFSSNKSSVISGAYLTLRGQVAFLPQYKNAISNAQLVIEIPQSASFVENSVIAGKTMTTYSIEDNKLSIPISNKAEAIRFCIIPTESGEYQPYAYVQCEYNGKIKKLPIGNAYYKVEDAIINVITDLSKKTFLVGGQTTPYSDIEIFDNGAKIGSTKAKASGTWNATCNIPNPYNLSLHNVYATILTPDGLTMNTQSQQVQLEYNNVQLQKITMTFYNAWMHQNVSVVWDYMTGKMSSNSYSFYTETNFNFEVQFSNNDPSYVKEAILQVYTDDNTVVSLPLKYDSKADCWKASRVFSSSSLPVRLGVKAKINGDVMVDSDQIHDWLARTAVEPEQPDQEKDIMQRINDAINNNNYELAAYLLDSLENDIPSDEQPMTMDEIQQLVNKNDSVVDSYPLDVFSTDIQVIQDSLAKLQEGMTIGDCTGLDPQTLVQQGYTVFPKTKGGNLYILSSEKKWEVVDFEENIHYVVDLQSNGTIAKQMRRTMNATADDFIQYFQAANDAYQKFNDFVQSIAGVITSFQQALANQNKAIRQQQGYLKEAYRNSAGNPKLQKSILQSRAMNHVKMTTNHTRMYSLGRFRFLQAGTGFSILAIGGTFLSGIKDGFEIYDYYKSILPCPDDLQKAMQLRQDIYSFGKAAGIYYTAQIGVAIAQLVIFNTAIGASFFTAGTSLVAAGVAIGVVVASYTATVAYGKIFERNVAEYKARLNALECYKQDSLPQPKPKPTPEEKGNYYEYPLYFEPITPIHDPSGFVYEAVEDNRLEGVKATVYYKEMRENVFGEMVEEEIVWNAEDFDQENPLYTDEYGFYQWFVPQGMWQVRFEKEGYEPTQSEWLPVPPPQLEVNIPMVQLRQPEVKKAAAHKDAIDITFDKYMMPSLLNTENIFVTANGLPVEGSVTLMDEQNSYENNAKSYASKVRFVPSSNFTASSITLTVSNRVHSYADVPMAQTFQQTFDVENAEVMTQTQAPVPSIPTGTFIANGTELTLSTTTENATIRYTMDGTDPDCLNGLIYSGQPLFLFAKQTVEIRAIACADGFNPSEVVILTYTIDENTVDIHHTEAEIPTATKSLENGILYIHLPDGRKVTILGSQVR